MQVRMFERVAAKYYRRPPTFIIVVKANQRQDDRFAKNYWRLFGSIIINHDVSLMMTK